jgi:hypothetical protein
MNRRFGGTPVHFTGSTRRYKPEHGILYSNNFSLLGTYVEQFAFGVCLMKIIYGFMNSLYKIENNTVESARQFFFGIHRTQNTRSQNML